MHSFLSGFVTLELDSDIKYCVRFYLKSVLRQVGRRHCKTIARRSSSWFWCILSPQLSVVFRRPSGTHSPTCSLETQETRGPQPCARAGTSPWPVRNQAAQQEVSGRPASKASFELPPKICLLSTPIPTSLPICGKIVFCKAGPWCQKGWGLLQWTTFLDQLWSADTQASWLVDRQNL